MEDIKDIQLEDVGVEERVYDNMPCCSEPITKSKKKKRIFYPSAYFNNKEFPSIINYDVGDEILLVSKAKIKSKSINERDGNISWSVDVELIECGTKLIKANEKKDTKEIKKEIISKLK